MTIEYVGSMLVSPQTARTPMNQRQWPIINAIIKCVFTTSIFLEMHVHNYSYSIVSFHPIYPKDFYWLSNRSCRAKHIIVSTDKLTTKLLFASGCLQLPLTHWGRDKMDAISQTTFSYAFSWMKIFEFRIFEISLKFVPKDPMNNIPSLVQIMAWRRPGDKPSSEPMMISLPTHICVTRPQWVKRDNSWTSECTLTNFDYHMLVNMVTK